MVGAPESGHLEPSDPKFDLENKGLREVDFRFWRIAFYHRIYKLYLTFAKMQNGVAKTLWKQMSNQ